jgi:protease-4
MVPMEAVGLQGKSRIALVIGEGDITRGEAGDDGSAGNNLTSYGFDKLLRQVAGDSTIKGVVVRIDSPGGEQVASDEIWRQMNLLSKKKPLVFSMSDLAASGGYYIAMTGDPIVAYPETMTGSIGVVFGKPNLHGLYDKLGITKDSVERGKHAGIDSDYASLTPDERRSCATESTKAIGISSAKWRTRGAAASTTSSRWRRGAYGWARRPRRGGWWTNWAASTAPSSW